LKLFVGLDLSTTNTGVVILNSKGNIFKHTLLSPNKAMCLEDRVVVILKSLKNLFDTYKDDYEIFACIESAALFGKGKRNELAMLNGAVYYFLKVNEIDVVLVPPSKLKKFATGNGRADKKDMLSVTPKRIASLFQSNYKKYDDVVDAYWLSKFIFFDTQSL